MYLIVFNIEQHYYRIFNAVYMIYEEERRNEKMISVIKRDGHRATYDRNKLYQLFRRRTQKSTRKKELVRNRFIIY